MTPAPHFVELESPMRHAQALMQGAEVRHLPVVSGGRLVGIITERDVTRAMAVAGPNKIEELLVSDADWEGVYSVETTERLDVVVQEMADRRIGSAVVTKNGKLVGIITSADVCRLYAELLRLSHPDA
jgi:acetoin utilization protein AcuB